MENPNYVLDPLVKSWAMQLDKEQEQKRKWQQSVESKGDWCAKWKANLQLAHVHEGKAQLDGHFYEHGKAFNTSENEKVNDDDMDKKWQQNHQVNEYVKQQIHWKDIKVTKLILQQVFQSVLKAKN